MMTMIKTLVSCQSKGQTHLEATDGLLFSLASEGIISDFNFMTLLSSDACDMFWMSKTEVCDELLAVARSQFLGKKFRKACIAVV
jgi:hypothetical protein